jgi:hypothetical protein
VKRLFDLTAQDLAATPVWRYEGGNGAEAMAAPTSRTALSLADDEIFLAATDFELFDATKHVGFCFPADDSGIDYLQPVIVTGAKPVSFWFERAVPREALEQQWKALGKTEAEIFPVGFRCLVPVDGRTVSGRIPAVEFSREEAEPSVAATDAGKTRRPSRAPAARPVSARKRGGVTERRVARRRKAGMNVEFAAGSLYGTGVVENVSRRGMFVRSMPIPETGPALRLTVHFSGGRKLVLMGRVVRKSRSAPPSAASHGFGLRLAEEWPDYEDLFPPFPDESD